MKKIISKLTLNNAIRWVLAFGSSVISFFHFGCMTKVETVYRDVISPIPIACIQVMPQKPNDNGSVAEINLKILRYSREMELLLSKCVAGDQGEAKKWEDLKKIY